MQDRPTAASAEIRRVMIVDDHPLLRAGLAALIGNEPDLEVCCEAESADDALVLARTERPNLIVLDISLAEGSGLELIKRLTNGEGEPRILVCSMHDESLFAQRVLAAGARGYINKQEATTRVIEAIRRVLSGKVYLSQRMTERLQQNNAGEARSVDTLSDRELEVFGLIGAGFPSSRIAEQLHLSVKTIETHRENIKKKLNLKSGGELTRYAVQWTLEQK